jgi:hypothetical protein
VVTVQPGAIKSGFGDAAAKSIRRDNKSVYAPVADYIKARAYASQKNPTSAEELSRLLVDKLSRKKIPSIIRIGRESVRLPLLKKLPVSVLDHIMTKTFGLNKLRK